MTNSIVGTKIEDLMQIYSKPVIIQGSLTVQDVTVSTSPVKQEAVSKKSKIVKKDDQISHDHGEMNVWVNNFRFDYDSVFENFWMKNIDQVSL